MKKRLLSLAMIGILTCSLVACGKSSSKDASPASKSEDSEEKYSYNITACLSDDNKYNQTLYKGFEDALTDYLGADSVTVKKIVATDKYTTDYIASKIAKSDADLIYTVGKPMLLSAAAVTEEKPIVATGVVDFQGSLRIADSGNSSWDKTTGRNITGVSSKPSIVDQVSLMIEATPDLQTVGILFSPEDTDSIYQNEIFEKYLDQAGIPWKEYSIPATAVAIDEKTDTTSEVLTPNKFVAPNAKQGMDNSVESIGENLITGLNSISSARVAQESKHWTGGKVIEDEEPEVEYDENGDPIVPSEDEEAPKSDKEATKEDNESTDEPSEFSITDDVTLEERITQVCNECSAIYIPFGSMLSDQANTICTIATEAKVTTIGGDTTLGHNTLVSLFSDPYELGYSAGKKAVNVLNGTDITTMKISNGSTDNIVKLYNADIAEKMGITFPKSFHEIYDFLGSYEYGSTTTRHSADSEDEK